MHAQTSIYQVQQIRQLEQLAQTHFHLTPQQLMLRAGKAAHDFLIRRWPSAQRIVIVCGGGNNGGDGYVLAQEAYARGLKVTIVQVGSAPIKEPAQHAYLACKKIKFKYAGFY